MLLTEAELDAFVRYQPDHTAYRREPYVTKHRFAKRALRHFPELETLGYDDLVVSIQGSLERVNYGTEY